jgi:hypothetical protein
MLSKLSNFTYFKDSDAKDFYDKHVLTGYYMNEEWPSLTYDEIESLQLLKTPFLHQNLACTELIRSITVDENNFIKITPACCGKDAITFELKCASSYYFYCDPVGCGKTFTIIMLLSYINKNKVNLNKFGEKEELNIKNFMLNYEKLIKDYKSIFESFDYALLDIERERMKNRTPEEIEAEDRPIPEIPAIIYDHDFLLNNIKKASLLFQDIENFVNEHIEDIKNIIESKSMSAVSLLEKKINLLCSNIILKYRRLMRNRDLYVHSSNEIYKKYFKHVFNRVKKVLGYLDANYTIDGYVSYESQVNKSVVYVPDGLLSQWKKEFETGCPHLNVFYVNSDETEEQFRKYREKNQFNLIEKNDNWYLLNSYDVFVITASYWSKMFSLLEELPFQLMIVDEIDTIKLPEKYASSSNILSKNDDSDDEEEEKISLRAMNIIFITGTPKNMIGRKECLFNYLEMSSDYDINQNLLIRTDTKLIEETLNLPPSSINKIYCQAPASVMILNGLLPLKLSQMLNAGNYLGAINIIGGNTQDNIMTNIKNTLIFKINKYSEQKEKIIKEIDNLKAFNDKNNALLQIELYNKIEELQKKIDYLTSKLDTIIHRIKDSTDICQLCLTEYADIENKCLMKCCQKYICLECVTSLMSQSNKCINCHTLFKDVIRSDIIKENEMPFIVITDKEVSVPSNRVKTKNDHAIECIINSEGATLLYVNYLENVEDLLNDLDNASISYGSLIELDMTDTIINETINKYISGEIKVLVLCAINYCAGYNLQNTVNIIFLNVMNDFNDQAIGRARRINLEHELKITYILYPNESIETLTFSDNFTGDYAEWLLGKDTNKKTRYENLKLNNLKMILLSEPSEFEEWTNPKDYEDNIEWNSNMLSILNSVSMDTNETKEN